MCIVYRLGEEFVLGGGGISGTIRAVKGDKAMVRIVNGTPIWAVGETFGKDVA